MDRTEPYIGMPIILGDSGMQEAQITARPPVRPVPLPETEHQMQPSCQSCLTDENCSVCQPQPPQQTMVVAMAYVPWQRWQQPYEYERGFETGTIFPDLDLPFLGYQGGRTR